MKPGTIVRIKANSIKKGLLKESCKKYMFSKGTITKSGPANCTNEVSVSFSNCPFDALVMPIESLEIIEEPKKTLSDNIMTERDYRYRFFTEKTTRKYIEKYINKIRSRMNPESSLINDVLEDAKDIFGKEIIY